MKVFNNFRVSRRTRPALELHWGKTRFSLCLSAFGGLGWTGGERRTEKWLVIYLQLIEVTLDLGENDLDELQTSTCQGENLC